MSSWVGSSFNGRSSHASTGVLLCVSVRARGGGLVSRSRRHMTRLLSPTRGKKPQYPPPASSCLGHVTPPCFATR